jgi:tyrosine-protein phosphatase SIW14
MNNQSAKTYLGRMYSTNVVILTFVLAALALGLPGSAAVSLDKDRPSAWAVPLEKEGLPNFFKVSDTLYRGAQPTRQGFSELKKMGIKTVVSLRDLHSDTDLIQSTDLRYFRIPMTACNPNEADFDRFLEIAQNPDLQPIFVHYMWGADRTGAAVALCRMKAQGWGASEAIKEMTNGGYGYNRWYRGLIGLIRSYEKP